MVPLHFFQYFYFSELSGNKSQIFNCFRHVRKHMIGILHNGRRIFGNQGISKLKNPLIHILRQSAFQKLFRNTGPVSCH